jgi:hypothetical protein
LEQRQVQPGYRRLLKEIPAELTGKFYFQAESSADLPCVGDWVSVQYHSNDSAAVIHEVFPRKTFLRRKFAGEKVDSQMIAANISVLVKEVDQSFQEILRLSADCRYKNCGHTQELGCAVRAAVSRGVLSEDRFSSYMKLKKGSEYHELSYTDKRKKERAYGRLLKSAKKQKLGWAPTKIVSTGNRQANQGCRPCCHRGRTDGVRQFVVDKQIEIVNRTFLGSTLMKWPATAGDA